MSTNRIRPSDLSDQTLIMASIDERQYENPDGKYRQALDAAMIERGLLIADDAPKTTLGTTNTEFAQMKGLTDGQLIDLSYRPRQSESATRYRQAIKIEMIERGIKAVRLDAERAPETMTIDRETFRELVDALASCEWMAVQSADKERGGDWEQWAEIRVRKVQAAIAKAERVI